MAEWTGLEPATSGVTGQHSNQLNYHSAEPVDDTEHPADWQRPRREKYRRDILLVGAEGFEPPTLSV